MLRSSGQPAVLPGTWTVATLPSSAANFHMLAYVSDRPGGAGLMVSDGVSWAGTNKRIEVYLGTTNGSGDYAVSYATAFSATPNVQPVTVPPADSVTRARLSATSTTGFTIRTERNATVNVLGIDVLSLGTAAVPSVPVSVLVVET